MKLRTIVKIAVTSSVVLLCAGFVMYSFFRLSAADGQRNFNLYELVPATTSAVFATDDVLEFVTETDNLTCSKERQYLYVSKLFSYLKHSLYELDRQIRAKIYFITLSAENLRLQRRKDNNLPDGGR